MADELSSFLDGGKPPVQEAEPAPASVESNPPPAEASQTEAPGQAEPNSEAEPAQAQPEPGDTRTVPLAALEGERRQRQDWKDRAARAEAQATELRRQLEAAAKPPPPPAPPAPPPRVIDPREDPAGYVEHVQGIMINQHLNHSELMLRKELGADAVDALIADFKAAAATDPSLIPKLYSQADPYGWAHQEMERVRLMREMADPAAYRARIRAEIEAELQGQAPAAAAGRPASPAAGLMPSIANVRSSAPRSSPAFSGPPAMEDILRRPAARR